MKGLDLPHTGCWPHAPVISLIRGVAPLRGPSHSHQIDEGCGSGGRGLRPVFSLQRAWTRLPQCVLPL